MIAWIVLTAGLLIFMRWALMYFNFLDIWSPGRKFCLVALKLTDRTGQTEEKKNRKKTKAEMIGEIFQQQLEAISEEFVGLVSSNTWVVCFCVHRRCLLLWSKEHLIFSEFANLKSMHQNHCDLSLSLRKLIALSHHSQCKELKPSLGFCLSSSSMLYP